MISKTLVLVTKEQKRHAFLMSIIIWIGKKTEVLHQLKIMPKYSI